MRLNILHIVLACVVLSTTGCAKKMYAGSRLTADNEVIIDILFPIVLAIDGKEISPDDTKVALTPGEHVFFLETLILIDETLNIKTANVFNLVCVRHLGLTHNFKRGHKYSMSINGVNNKWQVTDQTTGEDKYFELLKPIDW